MNKDIPPIEIDYQRKRRIQLASFFASAIITITQASCQNHVNTFLDQPAESEQPSPKIEPYENDLFAHLVYEKTNDEAPYGFKFQGKTIKFTAAERTTITKALKTPDKTGFILAIPTEPTITQESINSLPPDLANEEFLKEHGITIIEPPNFKLFIREKAFTKNSILGQFVKNTNQRLDIIVTDGPFVDTAFLPPNTPQYIKDTLDKKYSLKLEKDSAKVYKALSLLFDQEINSLNEKLDKNPGSFDLTQQLEIAKLKKNILALSTTTDLQFLSLYLAEKDVKDVIIGLAIQPSFDNNKAVIVTTGRLPVSSYIVFLIDSTGNIRGKLISLSDLIYGQGGLDPNQSFIEPAAFPKIDHPNGYQYANNGHMGFITLHEFGHIQHGYDLLAFNTPKLEKEADEFAMQIISQNYSKSPNHDFLIVYVGPQGVMYTKNQTTPKNDLRFASKGLKPLS